MSFLPSASSGLAKALTGPQAPRRWRCLFTLLAVSVLALALLPAAPKLPSLGWDKLNHIAAFVALAFAARFAFPQARQLNLRLTLALLAFGVAIELAQSLTPDRTADAADLVADGIGIAIGLTVAAMAWRWLRRGPPQ